MILCSNGRPAEKYVWDMAGQIVPLPYLLYFFWNNEQIIISVSHILVSRDHTDLSSSRMIL
jgi:hypothetical protein